MAGKKGMKGSGLGGSRKGAGRPRGSRSPHTRALLVELARYRDPEVDYLLPSVFMKRVMNDQSAPIQLRLVAAAKVIPFVERKPAPFLPNGIPLFRDWTDEQFEDFDQRTREDMRKDPNYYGKQFF